MKNSAGNPKYRLGELRVDCSKNLGLQIVEYFCKVGDNDRSSTEATA